MKHLIVFLFVFQLFIGSPWSTCFGQAAWNNRSQHVARNSRSRVRNQRKSGGKTSSKNRTAKKKVKVDASFKEMNRKAGDRASMVIDGVEFNFRWCPPGTFTMGLSESEYEDMLEGPMLPIQHQVTLTEGFWMLETEVTVGMFKLFANETGYQSVGTEVFLAGQRQGRNDSWRDPNVCHSDNHPVTCISYDDSTAFCKWLEEKTGLTVTLPTEAQWEYACRAGTTGKYAGPNAEEMGWFFSKSAPTGTHPVAQKKANAWGLYDMHGNVWERCTDYEDEKNWRGSSDAVTDPTGPPQGGCRIIRGGSAAFEMERAHSSGRLFFNPACRNYDTGFRVIAKSKNKHAASSSKTKKSKSKTKKSKSSSAKSSKKNVKQQQPRQLVKECKGIKYVFCWCPPGTFMMGSPEDEKGHTDKETQHKVTLTKGFWMLESEVTQAMWRSIMGNNPSINKGDNLPVEYVKWSECQEFCRRLSKELNAKVSLPTEAQWEYACRAGTTGAYACADGDDPSQLWLTAWRPNMEDVTHPVKQQQPNAWGLYDMQGNVGEWCSDWYDDGYSPDAVTDPTGPATGICRIYRGGKWSSVAEDCFRSACRMVNVGEIETSDIGFRVVIMDDK